MNEAFQRSASDMRRSCKLTLKGPKWSDCWQVLPVGSICSMGLWLSRYRLDFLSVGGLPYPALFHDSAMSTIASGDALDLNVIYLMAHESLPSRFAGTFLVAEVAGW